MQKKNSEFSNRQLLREATRAIQNKKRRDRRLGLQPIVRSYEFSVGLVPLDKSKKPAESKKPSTH